jgi:GNAT superfamily N-acetyltransferase
VLTLGYSLELLGRDAFIDEFYFRETYRGRGWGRQAIAFVEDAARSLGVNSIHSLESRVATRLESINLGNALSSPWVGRRPMANSVENHLHYICIPISVVAGFLGVMATS